ncbi:hypothetical protein Tco_0098714 [Tanacetum coccineum]
MTPIRKYIDKGMLPEDHVDDRTLMEKIGNYTMEDGVLYRKSYLVSLMRFVIPATFITGNGTQFVNDPFKKWAKNSRSRVTNVLWVHRTIKKTSNGETPFNLTYGTEAVIPAEIGILTHRTSKLNEKTNDQELRLNLDLLEERREIAAISEARYKQHVEKYYNKKTELISPDLICPLTYQLLRNSSGDSGPDLSFDKSASPERLFSLARVSLAEASKLVLPFGYVACFLSTYFLCNVSCDNFPTVAPFPSFPINSSILFTFHFILAISGAIVFFSAAVYFALDFSLSLVPLSCLLTFSIMAKKDMDLYHSRLTQDDLNDLVIKYKIPRDLHPRMLSEEFVMSEPLDDAIDTADGDLHWKSGFFFIDRRAIPNAMVWIHPDAAIDDLRPAASSFNMANVRHLSTHVVKLRDMLEVMGIHDFLCLPEWTGAEVQEEPHLDVRPTLQRLPFYCNPLAAADAFITEHALEDLVVGTPSSKIVAKAKSSQKRKASTSGATSSHVVKHTRSALAQSSSSTTRPSLFVGDDDESDADDDACVKTLLVAPLCSADRPSSGPAPLFRDVSGDAIHTDFFPFSAGPYYATYLEDGVAGNCEFTQEEWDTPCRPTFEVLTNEVFKDPAICKTIVDRFPTPGEMLLAGYHGLNQSHYEYVLSIDSRLKGYEEEVASLIGLELQVSTLKKEVYGLTDKLATSDASFAKYKAKGKERKKKIKSLTKSLDNLHSKVARLSGALNQATILDAERVEEFLLLKATPIEFSSFFQGQFQGLVQKFLASDEFSRIQGELLSLAASAGFEHELSMHLTKDEFVVVLNKMVNFMPSIHDRHAESSPLLKPEKLARPANVPIIKDTRSSPPVSKESIVTLVSKSLELSVNVVPASSIVASEQNDELAVVESECVSSSPTDVVVAFSFDGKGDVLIPSYGRGVWYAGEYLLLRAWGKLTVDVLLSIQQILSHATHPKPTGFPPRTFSIAGQAFTIKSGPPHIPEQMFISYVRIHYKLLVFPSSLVVICSLHDVVVHQSPLLGIRDHYVAFGLMLKFSCFNFAFPYVFYVYGVITLVVVALSVDGKGNVLIPSSVVGEENSNSVRGGACGVSKNMLFRAWGKPAVDVLLSHPVDPELLSEADIMLLCPALELAWLLARLIPCSEGGITVSPPPTYAKVFVF